MKNGFKLLIICLSLFFIELQASHTEHIFKPENIHILLEKDATEALLEVRGAYYIFNPHDGAKVTSGILGKRFIVRATTSGIKWGQEFPGIHQIVIIPRSNDTTMLLNGIQYEGAIAVYKIGHKIHIVNQVDVESYLKSILTTQFQYPLEPEVMAALSIASRTTAYYQIYKNKHSFWHIDGSALGYQGCALVIPNSPIVQGVDATKDLILINQKNKKSGPFVATWTEHSAGKTAALEKVFRKDLNAPDMGVETPHAALSRQDSRWSYFTSTEKLAQSLNLEKITSVDLFQDKESNKTYAIRFSDGKMHKDIDFITFQQILGGKNIKSNDISVFLKDKDVHFIGYGQGHGTGMCLFSASAMAQNGRMAIEILSNFYPNTYIMNLSATVMTDASIKN